MATGDMSTNNAGSSFILVPQEPSYNFSGSKEETKNIEAEAEEEEKSSLL